MQNRFQHVLSMFMVIKLAPTVASQLSRWQHAEYRRTWSELLWKTEGCWWYESKPISFSYWVFKITNDIFLYKYKINFESLFVKKACKLTEFNRQSKYCGSSVWLIVFTWIHNGKTKKQYDSLAYTRNSLHWN